MGFWRTVKRVTGLKLDTVVSDHNRTYWLRPASKASTLGAYVLGLLALVLHFF